MFNNYGAKPNDELLLGYGFVLQDNIGDFVSLRMGTACSTRPTRILDTLGIGLTSPHYIKLSARELPQTLLAQLRVLVADDEELDELEAKVNAHRDALEEEQRHARGLKGRTDAKSDPTSAGDTQKIASTTATVVTKRQVASEEQNGAGIWRELVGFVSWTNEFEAYEQLQGMLEQKCEAVSNALQRCRNAVTATTTTMTVAPSSARNGKQEYGSGNEDGPNSSVREADDDGSDKSTNKRRRLQKDDDAGIPSPGVIREEVRRMAEIYLKGKRGSISSA